MKQNSLKRGGAFFAAVLCGVLVIAGCGSGGSGATASSAGSSAPTQSSSQSAGATDSGTSSASAEQSTGSYATESAPASSAGGSGAAPSGTAPVSPPQGPNAKLTVGTPGIPPVISSMLPYIANEKGFYKAFGVDVTIKDFKTGTDGTRALSTGQIDVAITPPAQQIQLAAKGIDLVGVQGQEKPDWVVVSEDPTINSCEKLKGQSLGVDAIGGIRFIALNQMLKTCGLTIKDVHPLVFPGNQNTQAMIAGQLKVSVLHLNESAMIEEQRKQPLTTVMTMADVVPNTMYELFSVQKEKLAQLRPALVKWVAANIAALNWMFDPANADEVAKLMTKTGDTETAMKKAMQQYAKMGFWELDNAGMPLENITNMIKGQVAVGNVEQAKAPKASDLVDATIYADAQKLVQP